LKRILVILLFTTFILNADIKKEFYDNGKIRTEGTFVNDICESDSTDHKISYRNDKYSYYPSEIAKIENYVQEINESQYLVALKNMKSIELIKNSDVIEQKESEKFKIRLADGRVKVIDAEQIGFMYKYLGFSSEINYYIFYYVNEGGSGRYYVSYNNGKEFRVRGYPEFSENRKVCAYAQTEVDASEDTGLIEVYSLSSNGFVFLFGLWSTTILPVEFFFNGSSVLFIKYYRSNSDRDNYNYCKIDLGKL